MEEDSIQSIVFLPVWDLKSFNPSPITFIAWDVTSDQSSVTLTSLLAAAGASVALAETWRTAKAEPKITRKVKGFILVVFLAKGLVEWSVVITLNDSYEEDEASLNSKLQNLGYNICFIHFIVDSR